MSFGALFVGNSGQVLIDQDYPVYHVVASGAYSVASGGVITVGYLAAINSPNPPAIFMKPSGAHMIRYFKHLGSAGAWTGFQFEIYSDSGFSGVVLAGAWKAAALYLPAAGGWGLRVFDGAGRIVFDSNREVISFVGGGQAWSKSGHNNSYLGSWTTDTWSATYPSGTYFMVSHFNQWFSAGNNAIMGIGFISFPSSTVSAFAMRAGVGKPDLSDFNWPLVCIS